MSRINLKQIEAFVQVADLQSFRRAAERLHTTQPNISARIASLEAQLDQRLFERSSGIVRLTSIGATLLPKARQMMSGLDDFMMAADNDALFEGTLRLGVTEVIVHSWLGAYLSALKQRFQNVEVDLTVDFSASLSSSLEQRGIDLALQNGPFGRATSGSIELGDYNMIWVAAPSLDLHHRRLSFDVLTQHTILTHARGTQPYEQLSAHLTNAPASVRLVPSTNVAACIRMTIEGLGIACLPEVMVQQELSQGALTRLDYHWTPDKLRFAARFEQTAPFFVTEAAQIAANIARET